MIPSTRHPWQAQFAEAPRPRAAAGTGVDDTQVGLRVGTNAFEDLREIGDPVGPVLCCLGHGAMLAPVTPGTARWGRAAHPVCQPGSSGRSGPSRGCSKTPCAIRRRPLPNESPYATTAPAALDRLSATRSLMRLAA
jgi:hypothetical protein